MKPERAPEIILKIRIQTRSDFCLFSFEVDGNVV